MSALEDSAEQQSRVPRSCTTQFRCCSAFSLVEVTLAMGVMAFALVATFGLLPTGLNTFRASMDRTVGAQISQTIISERSKQDFSDLTSTTDPVIVHFNDEGQETEENADDSVFAAQVEVVYPVSVPSTGSSRFDHFGLAQVRVRIVRDPGESPDFGNPSAIVHDHSAFFVRR